MDELNPGTVDIFIAALSQVQGSRSGPIGRVEDLKNGVVTHYDPGRGQPRRIKIKQRNGFRTLPVTGHSATTGAASNPSWNNPELLSSIGSQVLSIANAIPRVWDSSDFTHYADERVVSNVLSESTFHTSQRTIVATDDAWADGVTCSVWSERVNPDNSRVVVYIGFKSDDGAWIRTPQILYNPATLGNPDLITYARVIADDGGQFFWVAFNSIVSSADKFTVKLFDLNGRERDTINIAKIWVADPGYWDIAEVTNGGMLHAQPRRTLIEAADGIRFTSFTQTAGVIGALTVDNNSVKCRGPLAFATNDLGDGNWYLATMGIGADPPGRLWGYQITPPAFNVGKEYNFAIEPPADTIVDSLIGFVTESTDPDGIPNLFASFTLLQGNPAIFGPPWDPQLRYSQVYECDPVGAVTFIRQNDYTCQVSRAFLHDDEYYSLNYYQSGSGNLIQSTQSEVEFTAGDYMIGAKEQPIAVAAGVDKTTGSAKTFIVPAGAQIRKVPATAPFAIASPDKVENVFLTGFGLPDNTPALKWSFSALSVTNPECSGARLTVAGSSIAMANGTWDIIGTDPGGAHAFLFTAMTNISGGTLVPGTFSAAGGQTAEIVSMTLYQIFDLATAYSLQTSQFLLGGSMIISGNATGANNGTKTIARAVPATAGVFNNVFGGGIWIVTGGESTSFAGFTATVSPLNPSVWSFANANVDDALLIGPHTLIIGGSEFILPGPQVGTPVDVNNDSSGDGYPITDVPSSTSIETAGSEITAQIFNGALPTVLIRVPDDVNNTDNRVFFLQSVNADQSYIGALLIVTANTLHPENNGVYQITFVDPDPTTHLIQAVPADGNTAQRSQLFVDEGQAITIVFRTNVQPEFQPCWLMVPLTGSKPVVGRFEYQFAYADWRFEGDITPNMFPLAVTSPVRTDDSVMFILPYRAISFTVGQSIATANGQIVNAAVASNQSTVGTKRFDLKDRTGNATVSSSQLMLPGPMCGEFTTSGFTESGVNFGFEAPFLVSQQVSDNPTAAALRVGGSYQVMAVGEFTTEDGNRVFSIVSPPLNYTLSGANNSATYGVRLIQPFDTNGNAIPLHFGVTNVRLVGISLYRTAYQNNAPTTDHHKITLDLNVNGLSPVSDTNLSGFSFPDEFTANYIDENIDAAIVDNELLYTDKGFLPRFPGPAQRNGDSWKERTWLVGYDGAIWMSAEKKEGDAVWFFPLWRIVLPTTDKPVAVSELDDFLIIGCERSMWYIPSANFPNATGREGTLPRPVQLPFNNGCTGLMRTLKRGVAYTSTDGGVWLITRDLKNEWFSQPVQDTLLQLPITGLTVDKRQRLIVATATGNLCVYDQTVEMWYNRWSLPTSHAEFLTTLDGECVFQDDSHIWLHDSFLFRDELAGDPVGIPIDITFSSFQFGNVRGLKSVWEMQLVGDYKGPHNINAILSYPDDDPDNPTVFPDPVDGPYTPDPDLPYLLAINPMIEQASSYGLRVFSDFDGIENPGNSFELEVISCEAGFDASTGLNKAPDNQRITGV